MRYWTWGALLAGFGLLGAAGAQAAPISYDCDTNEGSFSAIEQVQAGPAYHVRGSITPMQWRTHERWLASAQIRLTSADGSHAIAVQVIRAPGAERADFGVQSGTGGQPATIGLGQVSLNEALPFDLSVLASGDAIVTLGTERRVFHVDIGRNAKMSVLCSTGEFAFGDLDWGG
jgi:hypothetical protein